MKNTPARRAAHAAADFDPTLPPSCALRCCSGACAALCEPARAAVRAHGLEIHSSLVLSPSIRSDQLAGRPGRQRLRLPGERRAALGALPGSPPLAVFGPPSPPNVYQCHCLMHAAASGRCWNGLAARGRTVERSPGPAPPSLIFGGGYFPIGLDKAVTGGGFMPMERFLSM